MYVDPHLPRHIFGWKSPRLGLDMPTHAPHPENEPSDMGQNQNRGSAYRLFWGLSDRVLAMGRVDEAERHRPADARACARDQRHPAFESVHVLSSRETGVCPEDPGAFPCRRGEDCRRMTLA